MSTATARTVPSIYRAPLGLPLHWSHDPYGVLAAAVRKYHEHLGCGGPAPTPEEIELLWEYVDHHINAPAWTKNCDGLEAELGALRAIARMRGTIDDLRAYNQAASELALDAF